MIATLCQECGSSVDVPEEYLRQPVKCGGCQKVFIALPLAEAREKYDTTHLDEEAVEFTEPTYYFRLDGNILCAGTVRELAASKLLLQTDAVRMEAVPRGGGAGIPLHQLIDFSKPWRTTLEEGRKSLELPAKKPGFLETFTQDPLTPRWGGEYHLRVAGSSAEHSPKTLRSIIANPSFPKEDFWKVELKDAYYSGPYVPITAMLDFSKGWPEPPRASAQTASAQGPAPAAAAPLSQQVPIGDPPATEGLALYAGAVGFLGTVAGVILVAVGIQMESVPVGISGLGVIIGSILQSTAISLFCRLCRDVYALRRENQKIMENLRK